MYTSRKRLLNLMCSYQRVSCTKLYFSTGRQRNFFQVGGKSACIADHNTCEIRGRRKQLHYAELWQKISSILDKWSNRFAAQLTSHTRKPPHDSSRITYHHQSWSNTGTALFYGL